MGYVKKNLLVTCSLSFSSTVARYRHRIITEANFSCHKIPTFLRSQTLGPFSLPNTVTLTLSIPISEPIRCKCKPTPKTLRSALANKKSVATLNWSTPTLFYTITNAFETCLAWANYGYWVYISFKLYLLCRIWLNELFFIFQEEVFEQTHYPDSAIREQLSANLNLSVSRIQIW